MSLEAIFVNGVYAGVLRDIHRVQSLVPEQILYLQPFSGQRIVELSNNRPSVELPVRLFLSLTTDLPTIRYTCEIVDWNDKRELIGHKREIIDTVIRAFQPTEEGVYGMVRGIECVNLLSIWRMREISQPFSVAELRKLVDNQPVSTNRKTAGGWVYVQFPSQEWLEDHF
jgi:hypothetical protein